MNALPPPPAPRRKRQTRRTRRTSSASSGGMTLGGFFAAIALAIVYAKTGVMYQRREKPPTDTPRRKTVANLAEQGS